eukprot:TRINITY_DN13566_c0_g1_i1.p2 TRINITY_DN13566_c0_g1~~TRINITY_DN13566_c0_g1_i1.p2  ORF type:complete len:332 (+),score=103.42 TRINITY_DN13566_c0_g1_i1:83-997(+)
MGGARGPLLLLPLVAGLAAAASARQPYRRIFLYIDGLSKDNIEQMPFDEQTALLDGLVADVARELRLPQEAVPATGLRWEEGRPGTVKAWLLLVLAESEKAAVKTLLDSGTENWKLTALAAAADSLGISGVAVAAPPTPAPPEKIACQATLPAGRECTDYAEPRVGPKGTTCECTEEGYGCDRSRGACRRLKITGGGDDDSGSDAGGTILLLLVIGVAIFCGGNCMFYMMTNPHRLPYWVSNMCMNCPPIFSCEPHAGVGKDAGIDPRKGGALDGIKRKAAAAKMAAKIGGPGAVAAGAAAAAT